MSSNEVFLMRHSTGSIRASHNNLLLLHHFLSPITTSCREDENQLEEKWKGGGVFGWRERWNHTVKELKHTHTHTQQEETLDCLAANRYPKEINSSQLKEQHYGSVTHPLCVPTGKKKKRRQLRLRKRRRSKESESRETEKGQETKIKKSKKARRREGGSGRAREREVLLHKRPFSSQWPSVKVDSWKRL